MGRTKQKRVNSGRARTRARAYGTDLFVPAEPTWQPRGLQSAMRRINAEMKRRRQEVSDVQASTQG